MSDQTTGGAVSDYDVVGGGPAVSAVVNDFYERVLSDPQLAPYFEGVDLARLKRHQVLLISQVLGGPANYDGRALDEAHASLGISHDDLAAVAGHLVAAMRDAGVPEDIIMRRLRWSPPPSPTSSKLGRPELDGYRRPEGQLGEGRGRR